MCASPRYILQYVQTILMLFCVARGLRRPRYTSLPVSHACPGQDTARKHDRLLDTAVEHKRRPHGGLAFGGVRLGRVGCIFRLSMYITKLCRKIQHCFETAADRLRARNDAPTLYIKPARFRPSGRSPRLVRVRQPSVRAQRRSECVSSQRTPSAFHETRPRASVRTVSTRDWHAPPICVFRMHEAARPAWAWESCHPLRGDVGGRGVSGAVMQDTYESVHDTSPRARCSSRLGRWGERVAHRAWRPTRRRRRLGVRYVWHTRRPRETAQTTFAPRNWRADARAAQACEGDGLRVSHRP